MSQGEKDWLYEGWVRRAREGNVTCARAVLERFSEYVIHLNKTPPAFLMQYVAECLDRVVVVERPSRGNEVAKALGLVGKKRGKSPTQEANRAAERYKHHQEFWKRFEDAELTGAPAAEIVNAIVLETAEKFGVIQKTIQRSLGDKLLAQLKSDIDKYRAVQSGSGPK